MSGGGIPRETLSPAARAPVAGSGIPQKRLRPDSSVANQGKPPSETGEAKKPPEEQGSVHQQPTASAEDQTVDENQDNQYLREARALIRGI
jgi:hypothetical protein